MVKALKDSIPLTSLSEILNIELKIGIFNFADNRDFYVVSSHFPTPSINKHHVYTGYTGFTGYGLYGAGYKYGIHLRSYGLYGPGYTGFTYGLYSPVYKYGIYLRFIRPGIYGIYLRLFRIYACTGFTNS